MNKTKQAAIADWKRTRETARNRLERFMDEAEEAKDNNDNDHLKYAQKRIFKARAVIGKANYNLDKILSM